MYPFGADGTLGWATPAGELLQVASCIENKLIGVDYKKSLERGEEYRSRGKILERALDSSQGSGYGIGLSLKLEELPEPHEVSWILNRWPRFSYCSGDLDIRLQYYVEEGSVFQQYQIRNCGQEEKILPYVVSSDVCFREHDTGKLTFYPVPTHKSIQRLLLLKNSEVWVRDTTENVQMKMAVFLNAQRHLLWADTSPIRETEGEDDGEESEDPSHHLFRMVSAEFQEAISTGKFWSERQENQNRRRFVESHRRRGTSIHEKLNYAEWRSKLVIPSNSTQELCVVIQTSALLGAESGELDQIRNPKQSQISSEGLSGSRVNEQAMQKLFQKIRHSQTGVVAKLRQFSLKSSDPKYRNQYSGNVSEYLNIGKAYVSVAWIGEASYYFFMAFLMANHFFRADGFSQIKIHFEYAKFLYTYGWRSSTLVITKKLSRLLSTKQPMDESMTVLWQKVQALLASIYLEKGAFSKAESIYQQALSRLQSNEKNLGPVSTRLLERTAWAQANQGKYEQANKNYTRLLDQQSSQRGTILSNLGFIARRLG